MRYAIIEEGTVTNIIVAEKMEDIPLQEGQTALKAHDWTRIGDELVDGDLPEQSEVII